jgi:hypothetical protein
MASSRANLRRPVSDQEYPQTGIIIDDSDMTSQNQLLAARRDERTHNPDPLGKN